MEYQISWKYITSTKERFLIPLYARTARTPRYVSDTFPACLITVLMPKSRYPTPPGASTSISDPPLFPGPPLAPTTPTKISDVNSPRTPVHLALLGRVDEHPLTASAGSRAPLLAKDFAQRNPKSYSLGDTGLEEEGNEASSASFVELDVHASPLTTSVPSIQSLDEKEKKAIDPNLIPPPSIHDAYLSKFITPITPTPPADRPNIVRASSAPGAPHSALLPSALSEQGHEIEGKPIFEIFNAELNTSAEDMVKVLKGHLEGVLKMQDEIGNMHLGLEGLDLTGEAPDASTGTEDSKDRLSEREKGVDEIMERVCSCPKNRAQLSGGLCSSDCYRTNYGHTITSARRSYHSLNPNPDRILTEINRVLSPSIER